MDPNTKIKELLEEEASSIVSEFDLLQPRASEVLKLFRKLDIFTKHEAKLVGINRVGSGDDVPPEAKVTTVTKQLPLERSKPKESIREGDESRRSRSTPAIRAVAAKRVEEAQKRKELLASAVLDTLENFGPLTLKDLDERHSESRYAISEALKFLKQTGRATHHTMEFQGSSIWYSFAFPVMQAQLREYIHNLPDGPISMEDMYSHFILDKRSDYGLNKMMKSLYTTGLLDRREGMFIKGRSPQKQTNSKDKKSNFGGAGVATSNDKLSSDKEVNAVISKIKSQGASVVGGGKHIQVRFKGKATTIGSTPNPNGFKEDKRALRNIGLSV